MRLTHLPQVVHDLEALPRRSLQVIAIDLMGHIKTGTEQGLPLEDHPGVGDLSDCRKVYFDDREGSLRYRIVFRCPSEHEAEVVEIVAVGPRSNLDVYLTALERLDRPGRTPRTR